MYHSFIAFTASSAVLIGWAADAFSHHVHRQRWSTLQQSPCVHHNDQWSSSSALHAEMNDNELSSASASSSSSKVPSGENYSTLTLLEHMHLLNTNVHKQSTTSKDDSKRSDMIDFFTTTLGFGMDSKSVDSLVSNKGVVFVNAGPTQLHLNDDAEYCQKLNELRQQNELNTVSGGNGDKNVFEIGLRYNSLEELKMKLASSSSSSEDCYFYDIVSLGDGRESVRITDAYDRVFVAREVMESNNNDDKDAPTISSICQQKVICSNNCTSEEQDDIVEQYAIPTSQTTCRGMDFIEFFVYVSKEDSGKTVKKIARFYDFFFDATTSVVNDGRSDIAIIAFGKIDDNGRAEQSMLFRAVVADGDDSLSHHQKMVHSEELGTGHHIAIYVGNCDEDFEVAASNCVDGGLLWVNPQFEDKVLDVESAMKCKQFRFKNIVDIETGETLYVLEHEIRSISHPLFPGGN